MERHRKKYNTRYKKTFNDLNFQKIENKKHEHHNFVVRVEKRNTKNIDFCTIYLYNVDYLLKL